MGEHSSQEVTLLLKDWCRGDKAALDRLLPLVHDELHRLAHRYMLRERAGHTLQTTALVNEAYMRLIDANQIEWQDRAHFFAISANLMRRILVDFARSRGYQKRGGNVIKVEFDDASVPSPKRSSDILVIDEILSRLAAFAPREARVVELRFFGGLSEEEAAEVCGVTGRTVKRDWAMAKSWLAREMRHGGQQ